MVNRLLGAAGLLCAEACTNFMVTPGASADGSSLLSYSCDGYGFPGSLSQDPAVNGSFNRIGMMNEHSVAIGETTFDGLPELAGSGKWDYYTLMEAALQKAKTAREMIHVMDALVKEEGYGATGESFTIGDQTEVWHMELMGKGQRDKGWVWVARRVPDGYVGGHANQARIRTFPLDDPENCIYSDDVISFAVEAGLYPQDAPKDEFSFADVYDPISFQGARRCEARVWYFFSKVGDAGFEEQYADYAQGHNLTNRMPLFIKPVEKVNLTSFFHYMRHHYEGSTLDSTEDISGGEHRTSFRAPPNEWTSGGHSYVNERPVGVPYAAFHYTAQLRSWLPQPIAGLNWFAADDSSYSVRVPFHGSMTRVPTSFSSELARNGMNFGSNFWVNSMVANFVYYRHDTVAQRVLQAVVDTEQQFIDEVSKEEVIALKKWSSNHSDAIEYLTSQAEDRANEHVKTWLSFYQELFVDHMDGLAPKGQQQGYAQSWYDRVASETGDRYRDVTESCEYSERKVRLINSASRAVTRLPREREAVV